MAGRAAGERTGAGNGPTRRILFRTMGPADAPAVAALHATSWRENYHDVLSAAYLAGDVESERAAAWRARLTGATDREFGIVAEIDEALVGFAYVINDSAGTEFGNLLDNLHVESKAQGRGLGREMLRRVAETLDSKGWAPKLWLWVYASNAGARRFYERYGAEECGQTLLESADGGRVLSCRYVWRNTIGLTVFDAPGS